MSAIIKVVGRDWERPFSSGTQFLDWMNVNCCRCKKYSESIDGPCEILNWLYDAALNAGDVPFGIAERMGLLDNSPPKQNGYSYVWECPEVDYTEEWKEELNRRAQDAEAERLTGDIFAGSAA